MNNILAKSPTLKGVLQSISVCIGIGGFVISMPLMVAALFVVGWLAILLAVLIIVGVSTIPNFTRKAIKIQIACGLSYLGIIWLAALPYYFSDQVNASDEIFYVYLVSCSILGLPGILTFISGLLRTEVIR